MGERISDLESRLAKDSHNSSKPPSTDGFRKKLKCLGQKGNRKSRGQKGHPGATLQMTHNPDKIRHLTLVHCDGCGDLIPEESKFIEKRQVFDLPELRISSTEYRAECGTCKRCGKKCSAEFPHEALQKVQYCLKFRSLLVFLNQYQLLSYARIGEFFDDIVQRKVSEGTLNNTIKSYYEKLESTEEAITEKIRGSACVGFKEELHQKWASLLIDLLLMTKKEVYCHKKQEHKSMSKQRAENFRLNFDRIIRDGLKLNPIQPGKPKQRGRPVQSSSRNLLVRLKNCKDLYLAFMYDFCIPFNNNGSERDIQMLKVQQKISGCFRSHRDADYFEKLRGYISTVRKNSVNIMDAIAGVFAGEPFLPA